MRIAMVSREFPPSPTSGGIGTYTEKTARALGKAGHQVQVFTEAVPGAAEFDPGPGVELHRLPARGVRPREARLLARTVDVAAALRRSGPFDVVQACEWEGEAALYAMRQQAPLISRLATPRYVINRLNDVAGQERRRNLVQRRLERWQARHSAFVISPSRALLDVVAPDWGIPEDRLAVVPTGIRLPAAPTAAPPPELRGLEYALYFGRLEARKGVGVWIDSLPGVLAANPGLHAVFVGEDVGTGGRTFRAQAEERCADARSRLHFIRHLPQAELFPVIAASTLVLMPSRWESLANACLEAMALGRPVVATTGSGFAEVIQDGLSGILVPPDDSAALGAAVNRALADPEGLQRIADGARRRAEDYDLDRCVDALVDVYRQVAGHPAVARVSKAMA